MARERIVVGSTREGDELRRTARLLRDDGHEVIFVGGHQTPEQLVRTAVSEDASRVVTDADEASMTRIEALLEEAGGGISVARVV